MTSEEMIAKLKNFDTPSITNVVATYPNHPLTHAGAQTHTGCNRGCNRGDQPGATSDAEQQ